MSARAADAPDVLVRTGPGREVAAAVRNADSLLYRAPSSPPAWIDKAAVDGVRAVAG